MSNLTALQSDILKLIKRSTPNPDGWYQVSVILWPSISAVCEQIPALVELNPELKQLRFTNEGAVVAKWL